VKIYTGTGDKGTTSLFSGERVPKHHDRVEAYGVIDELNAALGMLAAMLPEGAGDQSREIREIQSDLLTLGALLATTPDSPAFGRLAPLAEDRIAWIESAIDAMDGRLAPLKSFILPGGIPSAACAHVARTVCRRAERRMTALTAGPDAGVLRDRIGTALTYVNRLSDYLFVMSRYLNHLAGVADAAWRG